MLSYGEVVKKLLEKDDDCKDLEAENKKLRENPNDILRRIRYSLDKLGKEATLILIEQALKNEKANVSTAND